MSVTIEHANPYKKIVLKTNPTMLLKSLVAQSCASFGFTEPDGYILKLKRTPLDLSLSIRFANLAAGAKLSLERGANPSATGFVNIALQVEDHSRLVGSFSVSTCLWSVLLHFESTDSGLNLTKRVGIATGTQTGFIKLLTTVIKTPVYMIPVCIFMNREYGSIADLKATTLRSAGLESGSASIRCLFRFSEHPIEYYLQDIEATVETPTIISSAVKVLSVSKPSKVEVVVEPEIVETPLPEVIDRALAFYSPPLNESPKNSNRILLSMIVELPDSFFTLTTAEIKNQFSLQQAKVRQLESAPLKTNLMREREEQTKREKYPKTLIRVRFPDHTTLQASFYSGESLSSLFQIVQDNVVDSKPFVLYVTPPHRNLDRTKSFWESELMPASLVYFNWADGSLVSFLKPELSLTDFPL